MMRLFIIQLVMMLAFSGCLKVVKADDFVGSLNGKNYDSFKDLCSDLKSKYENKTVVIEMLTDWITDSGDSWFNPDPFDYRLYIPENCNATLNMNGHIFNRDLVRFNDYDIDGELIYVDVGATLTINGASKDSDRNEPHEDVYYFNGLSQGDATATTTTYGGTLAGGNGLAGTGGIYIDSGKDVYINDVTIIGCKAYYNFMYSAFHSGYGGGIIITEDNTKLHLKNSTITGCLAEQDGGGIYAKDDDNITIELDNSHVDKNYANSDGGGINMDGEKLLIKGKNNSSISFNETEGYGGGVYFWNDEVTLQGVTVEGNYAGDYGGGVYLQEEDSAIKECVIIDNSTKGVGGGVYINNDYTEINNTTITGNSGFGVYVNSGCDKGVNIFGNTVINNNTDGSGNRGNLRIEDNTSFVNFNQSDGMKVYLRYNSEPSQFYRINSEPCQDFSNHIFADRDDNEYVVAYSYYEIGYGDSAVLEGDSGGNYLLYVKTEYMNNDDRIDVRTEPPIDTIHTHDIHGYAFGKKVFEGGYTEEDGVTEGNRYQLRTLYPRHPSNGDRDFKMYYSDGFFFDDPYVYNNHLATASFSLASAGAYLGSYYNDYSFKHAATRQMLADIGCPDQMIYVDDYNIQIPGTDSIGVSIGSKTLQVYNEDTNKLIDTEYTLIVLTTRGANYEDEWASNVTLGDGSLHDGEALGFAEAADQVIKIGRAHV